MIEKYFIPDIPKIHYYKKKNGGTGSALNLGIRKARGQWIKWLSADDVLYPKYLQTIMETIKYSDNPFTRLYYSSFHIINEKGEVIGKHEEPDFSKIPEYEFHVRLLEAFIGNGSSSLIHRSMFERVGLFDETLPMGEDYEWWLRAVLLHGIQMTRVPGILIKYRSHENTLTAKFRGKSAPIEASFKKKILKTFNESRPPNQRIAWRPAE